MSAFKHSVFARDFSAATKKALLKKGLRIAGTQAVPDFEGDRHFSGVAYQLVTVDGRSFMRTHSQVITISKSSWSPDDDYPTDESWE